MSLQCVLELSLVLKFNGFLIEKIFGLAGQPHRKFHSTEITEKFSD